MSAITKEEALAKLGARATVFLVLTIIFMVVTVVFLGIWVGSFFYATAPLIVGGVTAVLGVAFFNTWFITSSLFLHAAATK